MLPFLCHELPLSHRPDTNPRPAASLGLTTIFGNPGSTEEPFLKNLPEDFTYVLGLQEASVLAMADGYAQATGKPVLVNLHTVAGTGNAMGNLSNAWLNKTPLVITAGQQTREMLLLEPLLTNVDATTLPKPLVKWSYQPGRPQDVPGSLLRAYATAFQPPQGPVYVSLPVDDWDQKAIDQPGVDISAARSFSHRFAPDPERLSLFAQALAQSENPALVFGAGVDRSGGWHDAVRLAEVLRAAVYAPPENERVGFPEDHPLYQGELPPAIEPLGAKLKGHDVVLVVGAPVFRYYPYVPGDFLPKGTRLLHITDDPDEAARAVVGESLLGDPALSLAALVAAVLPTAASSKRKAPTPQAAPEPPAISTPPSPGFLFHALAQTRPADAILVQESLSNVRALKECWRTTQPGGYLAFAGGGLGFGLPAAVGVALAQRATGRNRRVVAVIGDGAFQYSVQALVDGGATGVAAARGGAVQRRVRHPQVVCQTREDGRRPGAGPARPRLREVGGRLWLHGTQDQRSGAPRGSLPASLADGRPPRAGGAHLSRRPATACLRRNG